MVSIKFQIYETQYVHCVLSVNTVCLFDIDFLFSLFILRSCYLYWLYWEDVVDKLTAAFAFDRPIIVALFSKAREISTDIP